MATFFMDINQDPIILKFLDYIKFEKRYSAHTFRAYSDDLMHFYGFLEMQFEVNQPNLITPAMIRSWMASLTLSKIQPRSINRKISSLKSFFKFCLVQGLIDVNPTKALQVLKTKKRLPSYIEQEQMDLLLNSTTFPDSFQGRTEYLSISILYQTGIRVSELVNLKVTQIDRWAKQLKVLGKGNKERIIPLNKEMLKQVEVYIAERKLMFSDDSTLNLLVNSKGLPTNARKLYDVVKKYLSLVTTAEKKSPHVLRHSFATHLTSNGAELNAVKELLGHSSLAATQVYTHNSIERLRDIHKKAHPKG